MKCCEHEWYAPSINLRICNKCKKSIPVWPISDYDQKQFSKLFPSLSRKTGKIILNDEPKK